MQRIAVILLTLILLTSTFTQAQETSRPVITAENADQLTVIETLGRGRVTDAGWTADGETLVVASATGLWLYDADDLTAEPRFLPSEHGWIRSMAIHPTEPIVATGHETGAGRVWYLDDPYRKP